MATERTLGMDSEAAGAPAVCPFGHGAGPVAGAEAMLGATAPPPEDDPYLQAPSLPSSLRGVDAIPGPPPTPIVGWRANLLRYFADPINVMSALRSRYGNLVCLAKGGNQPIIFRAAGDQQPRTVFAFGPALNREVLTQPDLFAGGDFRAPKELPWINGSMINATGDRRSQQKAVMSPAFTRGHLKTYYHAVLDESDAMLDRWAGKKTFDLVEDIHVFTLNVASRCFYGQAPDGQHRTIAATIRTFAEHLMSPLAAIPLNVPGTPYHRLVSLGLQIKSFVDAEIAHKESHGGDDVLAMMVREQTQSGIRLDGRELVGNAVALFLAGHDVPTNAIVFTLVLLSQHPQELADLLDEVAELGGEPPTYEHLWQMPRLTRVLHESLRVLSPALLIMRQTSGEAALGGYRLPRGTEVLISPYMTHTDPEIYPEPRKFKPSRWETLKPSGFEYLPFSYGARRCLGASFAEMQLKLVLVRILQRYLVVPAADSKLDFKCTFVIHPKDRLNVSLEPAPTSDAARKRGRVPIGGQFATLVEVPP